MTFDPAQQTLVDVLQARTSSNQGITFISGQDKHESVPYALMLQRARKRLSQFQQAGLGPGRYLILQSNDNASFIEGFWACLLGGLVAVPIAAGNSTEHRQKLFRVAELLDDPALYTDEANLLRIEQFAQEHRTDEAFNELRARVCLVEASGDEAIAVNIAQPSPDDTAFVQFSSGSTSSPKGIVLSHRNLMTNIHSIIDGGGITADDHQISWMPLTHDMGLIGFHLTPLVADGSHSLLPTDVFVRRPGLWLSETQRMQASILCSPNFGYQHLLKSFKPEKHEGLDLSSVRLVFNGAEPISAALCEQFMRTLQPFGLHDDAMLPVYGLAEASLAVAFPALDNRFTTVTVDRKSLSPGSEVSILDNPAQGVRFVSVGRALKNISVAIHDEHDVACEERVSGRICIRGNNVTAGYLRQPELNAQIIDKNGWLDTGDLGFIHEGKLYITGRAKDIIFVNGQNIYPHDLEEILVDKGLAERGKLAISSMPQTIAQRSDTAENTAENTAEKLLVFILHRGELAKLETAFADMTRVLSMEAGVRIDALVAVPRIPKTTSGKVQRYQLINDYQAGEFQALHSPADEDGKTSEDVVAQMATEAAHDSTLQDNQELPPQDNNEAPASNTERLLTICNAHIEGMQLAVDDNLFELGISSLTLAEIHAAIEDTWPEQVDITDLFDYPTVAELAAFLDNKT